MRKLLGGILLTATLALSPACFTSDDDGNGGNTADAGDNGGGGGMSYAPDGLSDVTLQVTETGGPDNTWIFPAGSGTSGTASLAISDTLEDFTFTYSKTDGITSVLEFEVQGTDRYDMTWTSATSGTFAESFDGQAGNPGTFVLTPN